MATSHTRHIRRVIIPLLSLLILTTGIIPLAAAAPITLTPSKTQYNPGDTLVVSGTATPNSAVTIRVYNPAGNLLAIGQGNTDATGQYSVTVFTWPLTPTLTIPFGIYSITATDAANGDFTDTTVEYTQLVAPPPEVPVVEGALVQITVSTGSTYQLGDTARIFVMFSYNGQKVDPTATVFLIHTAGLATIPRTLTQVHTGLYYVDYTPTATGTYAVHAEATYADTSNVEITSFQVIEPLAPATLSNDVAEISTKLDNVQQTIISRIDSAQSALNGAISSAKNDLDSRIGSAQSDIKSSISSAQSALEDSISSAQSSLNGAISSAKNDLDSRIGSAQSDIKSSISLAENSIKSQITSSEQAVSSAIGGVQSAVTSAVTSAVQPLRSDIDHVHEAVDALEENLESTNAGVSAASTWIIVVGIIAAITLVLELVTLVRRLS